MRSGFALFFTIFLSIYAVVNFYVGYHGYRFAKAVGVLGHPLAYWPVFWFIALSYLLSRALSSQLPEPLYDALHLLGAYWLAAMLYLLLFFLAFDLVRLADRFLHFLPASLIGSPKAAAVLGIAVLSVIGALLALGSWNARNAEVTTYGITIPKAAGSLKGLDAVLVSDIHLGTIVDKRRLERLVDEINGLKPDIVLLAGDVLDEDLGAYIKQNMNGSLKRIAAPLGVYAIPGNHEYIGGRLPEFAEYLKSVGVELLIDRSVKVADAFYLVGRDDVSGARFNGGKRKALADLAAGLDPRLPLIVLDHQPFNLEEAEKAGADLQLSGHTHRGQFFPNNLITAKVFELDYGYKKKGGLNVVVSSGYGTWGPPIRIGSRSEIVKLKLTFQAAN